MSEYVLSVKPLDFPWETQSPFLFCAHHRDEYPAGNENMGLDPEDLKGRTIGQDFTLKDGWRMYHGRKIPGFPYHPHRGFETITINKEGVVDHLDSLGSAGRFMGGDVQWMTAGKGIQHSEMFPLLRREEPNPLEIFQIWLNLPRAGKYVEPHFKMLWKETVPTVNIVDENGKTTTVDVIAGGLNGEHAPAPPPDSWAADPENAIGIFMVKMEAGAVWTLPATLPEANRSFYFYKGDTVCVESATVQAYHKVNVKAGRDIAIENGEVDGFLMILQGRPIDEPVARYGPFVMNTQREIQQTIEEYRRTGFGVWPWGEAEQVHPRDKGRFALHADGREEVIP